MSKENKIKWVKFCIIRIVILYFYVSMVYMTLIIFKIPLLTIAIAFVLTVLHVLESLMLLIKNKDYMTQNNNDNT